METSLNPVRATPRDFFLNLFTIITLTISVIGFLTVVFQIANIIIPDPLDNGWQHSGYNERLRGGLALLIVAFPSYLGIMNLIYRINTRHPEKWKLGVRRWLQWFTLFATSVVSMVDLIMLINSMLSGELHVRFILKSIAVFFVMISIFSYYLWDLRTHQGSME